MRAATHPAGVGLHPGCELPDADDSMSPVARTCTELPRFGMAQTADAGAARPLEEFRSVPAYVLLGDPGAGKTTEFRKEAKELGESAEYVTARDFVGLDLDSHPEWRDRILFIDALDEMRAGASDARTPLDAIRMRLERLGRPQFRISCREADWLAEIDRRSLEKVSPDSAVRVLLLDPLDDQGINELLPRHSGPGGAAAFKKEAAERGLEAMLANPQCLELLASAVKSGDAWPESRLETFESACKIMAAEHNDEHRLVAPNHSTEHILDAAGYLCALLLLCGFDGFAFAPRDTNGTGKSTDGFVPLDDLVDTGCCPRSHEILQDALCSELFKPGGEFEFVPRHRLIAEFLAGRRLALLIRDGLPARRVAALMTGASDGRVVTSLRGLSAWLAAHPGEGRRQLIDADPVGVGLYGDIGGFNTQEKQQLLNSLVSFAAEGPLFGHARQDDRALSHRDETARAFRSLASAGMLEPITQLLNGPPDDAQRDRATEFVLEVLSQADTSEKESLTPLLAELEALLRDPESPSWVKKRSLDAYIHIAPAGLEVEQTLVAFLDAIRAGSTPDPDDQLSETLLTHLYPEAISPSSVWRYALPRPRHVGVNRLGGFWDRAILEKSSDLHVAELLDALSEDAERLMPAFTVPGLDLLPHQLLARGLRSFGDTIDAGRLSGWLDAAGMAHRQRQEHEAEARFARQWLAERPEVWKDQFLSWLRDSVRDAADEPRHYQLCRRLLRVEPPGGFGAWCLEHAVSLQETDQALAKELLSQAYRTLHDPDADDGLTLDVMRSRVGDCVGVLSRRLDELEDQKSQTESDAAAGSHEFHRRLAEQRTQRTEQERKQREEWREVLRSQLDDLLHNRFHAPNLDTLAQVCLGVTETAGEDTPLRRSVSDFIGGDEALIDAVLSAIREAVFRDDVPTVDETVALHAESKRSWLAYPVLASLRMISKDAPDRADAISDQRKREALAILFCVSPRGGAADWLERWFRRQPELVLDVLLRCAILAVRSGDEAMHCIDLLNGLGGRGDSVPALVCDERTGLFDIRSPEPRFDLHDDLIHAARLRLLKAVPAQGANRQLSLVDRLLAETMRHRDSTALREIARGKLTLAGMSIGQRIRWLAVDALTSPDPDLNELKQQVRERDNEARVRHLARFLCRTAQQDDMRLSVLADLRNPDAIRDAVEILGPWFPPARWDESGFITLGMEMSELLGVLITQLGTLAGDDSDRAFKDLVHDPRIEGWHDHLKRAHERQRVISRDASHVPPSIADVRNTLNRGAPANAADLAALLQDRLADVSDSLRGDSDNPWRLYWNEDEHRAPCKPKHEDSCRDALLTALKARLPEEVDAVPEGRYAADKRADLRVSCRDFNVAVEIKKNSHSDLWTAMRRQLIGKYTTDPATSGYGVYVVLWFGADATRNPPDGDRPDTPEALRQQLQQELTPDEALKIAVTVLDVTKPGQA